MSPQAEPACVLGASEKQGAFGSAPGCLECKPTESALFLRACLPVSFAGECPWLSPPFPFGTTSLRSASEPPALTRCPQSFSLLPRGLLSPVKVQGPGPAQGGANASVLRAFCASSYEPSEQAWEIDVTIPILLLDVRIPILQMERPRHGAVSHSFKVT